MADTSGLGSDAERREGSSPSQTTDAPVWPHAFSDFVSEMEERMKRGFRRFGREVWVDETPDKHLADMQEELVDFANYAMFMWWKLEKMRDRLGPSCVATHPPDKL